MEIESISNYKIAIQFIRENWIIEQKTRETFAFDDFGGFSGAGVFRTKTVTPEVMGIIFEHNKIYDILYCTKSEVILADGKLDKSFL